MDNKKSIDSKEEHITVQRLLSREAYVFTYGDYVLAPGQNVSNNKLSYWISRKGYTVSYYCFSVSSPELRSAYERDIREAMGCKAAKTGDLRSCLTSDEMAGKMDQYMQSYIKVFETSLYEKIQSAAHNKANRQKNPAKSLMDYVFAAYTESQKKNGISRCPRCGLPVQDPHCERHYFSDTAQLYICDICGVEEALESVKDDGTRFRKWAIVKNPKAFLK